MLSVGIGPVVPVTLGQDTVCEAGSLFPHVKGGYVSGGVVNVTLGGFDPGRISIVEAELERSEK